MSRRAKAFALLHEHDFDNPEAERLLANLSKNKRNLRSARQKKDKSVANLQIDAIRYDDVKATTHRIYQ